MIVSAAQRREQAEQVLENGLEEIFAEPFSSQTAARFEETAYVFWKQDREDDARACLAAAAAFRAGGAKENPVAKAMVELAARSGSREARRGDPGGRAEVPDRHALRLEDE